MGALAQSPAFAGLCLWNTHDPRTQEPFTRIHHWSRSNCSSLVHGDTDQLSESHLFSAFAGPGVLAGSFCGCRIGDFAGHTQSETSSSGRRAWKLLRSVRPESGALQYDVDVLRG